MIHSINAAIAKIIKNAASNIKYDEENKSAVTSSIDDNPSIELLLIDNKPQLKLYSTPLFLPLGVKINAIK